MSGIDRGLRSFRVMVLVDEGPGTEGKVDCLVSSEARIDWVLNTEVILSRDRRFLCAWEAEADANDEPIVGGTSSSGVGEGSCDWAWERLLNKTAAI